MAIDPIQYWEERHASLQDDNRNVGNRGLTSEQNFDLLVTKAVIVSHTLGNLGVPAGARILDAGCGAGVFTEILQKAGFEMTGIDAAPSAIASARKASSSQYEVAALSQFRADVQFDVVLCLDVLFHVINDLEWEASLDCLTANVRCGGHFIIIEHFEDYGKRTAPHVKWRSLDAYRAYFERKRIGITVQKTFRYPHENKLKTLLAATIG